MQKIIVQHSTVSVSFNKETYRFYLHHLGTSQIESISSGELVSDDCKYEMNIILAFKSCFSSSIDLFIVSEEAQKEINRLVEANIIMHN